MVHKIRSVLLIIFAMCLFAGEQVSAASTVDMFFCEQNPILQSCVNTCKDSSSSGTSDNSTSASGNKTSSVANGDGGGCGGSVEENKQQIWGFLKSKGLSDAAAAGIMGNMEQESSFKPEALNSLGCKGIVQWCFGREKAMEQYLAEHGRPNANCLGGQLEYLWYELTETGESAVMKDLNAATNARDAGNIFAEQFERMKPDEQVGRDNRAERLFEEFTGKPGSAPSNTGDSSQKNCASATTTSGGPIPSANCKAVQDSFKSLQSAGKITLEIPEINDDVSKCSEQKLERCTGGARAQTIRGLDAIAQNSGVDSIRLWNINEKHGCDQFDHPAGLASDIKQANGVECTNSNPEECKKVFDYAVSHADELGLKYIIWNGSYCTQQKAAVTNVQIYCNSDHNDHIHVSFKDS